MGADESHRLRKLRDLRGQHQQGMVKMGVVGFHPHGADGRCDEDRCVLPSLRREADKASHAQLPFGFEPPRAAGGVIVARLLQQQDIRP
jgi:hypothetical protein